MATEHTQSQPVQATPGRVEPIACTLRAGEQKTRLAEWRELRRDGLISETREGRILTTVWAGDGVPERLKALVEAEKQCCAFLDFEVEELGDVVCVRTVFPEGAEALLVSFTA